MAQPWFNPARAFESALKQAAATTVEGDFSAEIRPAEPRFGDFQANGVLGTAKRAKRNPRELAQQILAKAESDNLWPTAWAKAEIAGPGFINFTLSPAFLLAWLETYNTEEALRAAAGEFYHGRKVVVDFSSPNTAKEMHVGHIRSTVIGECLCRLLTFCGATVTRDNHLGDWGTQFGMLIWAIKSTGYDLDAEHENALADLENLYKQGSAAYKASDAQADVIRGELVKLQNGDPDSVKTWEKISSVSWKAFQAIYDQLGIKYDVVLGESFYKDKVEHIYQEMTQTGLAVEDQGALVVFHPEHPRFAKQPFIVRKNDGASNYATTDLATILHRSQVMGAEEVIYVVGTPQNDHFEQLFLTAKKWYAARGWNLPQLIHANFGTVLGENGKPIKTRDGGSLKLKELLTEAIERSYGIVTEKNPDLPETERRQIAKAVGLGAVRYVDLSQNRSSDYIFSWEKMLAFEGNTAPYLLYAVARIHSIFRKAELKPGDSEQGATPFETLTEMTLARKLVGFVSAIEQSMDDLRPHLLCLYLFELAGAFSAFYSADHVIVDDPAIRARRLILCARTLRTLETGLHLLGLETLERM
ncbi:MAG: arginine--tRNA ligase [Verrucomicrobiota bacterium]|nr:arginine--tRNA ligase [Verrucomicrobiota bacterium]